MCFFCLVYFYSSGIFIVVMKKYIKQILFLIVISVAFTELLSGNVQITQFLNPLIPAFLFTVGYGFPVLLIRELSVRWRSGLLSLFLMGLAYGILNEGILAKTLLMNVNVPINSFDGYVEFLGINYAWSALIVTWHAFFAVIFPITISHAIFPDKAQEQWLTRKTFWVLFALIAIAGTAMFLGGESHGISGTPALFAVFSITMVGLIYLAQWLRGRMATDMMPRYVSRFKQLPLALMFIVVFFVGTSSLGNSQVPSLGIILFVALLISALFKLLKKYGWLTTSRFATFSLWTYFSFGLFTFIWHIAGLPIIAGTVFVLEGIFLYMIFKVLR